MTQGVWLSLIVCAALVTTGTVQAQTGTAQTARPNIVLIFPDNLGWGEVGAYGSVRGALTPRIDRLAAEGIRLNNFNVEFSCTVSRAALLTGRYAIRTGAKEETDIKDANPWVFGVIEKLVAEFTATTERYPHVPMNARDPYVPPARD